jgi:hypothetical protein
MNTEAIYARAETAPRTKVNIASIVAAAALVVSGLALVATELVLANNLPDDPAATLAAIQANLQRYQLAQWITFVFTIVLPLGLIGVAALAYQRRAWVAYIGASLAIVGNLFHLGAFFYEGLLLPAMARLSDQRVAMVALLDQFGNDPALLVPLVLVLVFNLGLLIMTIGLWHKGIVPLWVVGLNVAGLILHFGFEDLYLAHFIALVLFAALLSAVGVALIRHSHPETAVG